jgi:hypothetical protein
MDATRPHTNIDVVGEPLYVQHATFAVLYDDSVGRMSQDRKIELLMLTLFGYQPRAI